MFRRRPRVKRLPKLCVRPAAQPPKRVRQTQRNQTVRTYLLGQPVLARDLHGTSQEKKKTKHPNNGRTRTQHTPFRLPTLPYLCVRAACDHFRNHLLAYVRHGKQRKAPELVAPGADPAPRLHCGAGRAICDNFNRKKCTIFGQTKCRAVFLTSHHGKILHCSFDRRTRPARSGASLAANESVTRNVTWVRICCAR